MTEHAAGARLRSLATAVGPYPLPQAEAKAFARERFAGSLPALERLLAVFDHAGVEERQLARPLGWYAEPHDFPTKNRAYAEAARRLAGQAGARALAESGIELGALRAVVFVSTTGIATPSLDAALVQDLDLPRSVARVPLWGLGCAGGVAGLARSADLARALGGPVLLVAVEVCSATFMHGDRTKANLVATALFGDGAAAAVLAPDGEGMRVRGGVSRLLDGTEDLMGWDLRPGGLQVRFARSIPAVVREVVPGFVETAMRAHAVEPGAVRHFVVHPGGAKVLLAYQEALGVERASLAEAWDVLARHGNLSSPTVLFVLQQFLKRAPPSGAPGLLLGLGPGFSAEGVVVSW